MSRKHLTDDDKIRILSAALETEDIRPVLAAEKLKRKELAILANKALDDGLLTKQEFDRITQTIERPKSFPADIEQRIEAVLSGVVNTEPKQILTLLLDDNPQSIEQLRDDFVETTSSVWAPPNLGSNIKDYLLGSLDPVGFVAHPVVQRGGLETQNRITEAGKIYGQPVAAYVLDLGEQLDFSFYQLLGRTSSNGESRAPYNRFRILEMLLNGDCREIDLTKNLTIDQGCIRRHLQTLESLRLVDFDSVGPEEAGWAVYEWTTRDPENVETVATIVKLTKDVASWLFGGHKGDYRQITEDLIKRGDYKNWGIESLGKNVSCVLSGLQEQGFATAHYQGGKKMSHVKLLPDRRGFVEEFTRKVRDALQDGTELDAMRRIHQQYQEDPYSFRQDATRRLQVYIGISPDINKISREGWIERILFYLGAKEEVRRRDIERDVGSQTDRYLTDMIKDGLLVKQQKGKATFYRVNPNYTPR